MTHQTDKKWSFMYSSDEEAYEMVMEAKREYESGRWKSYTFEEAVILLEEHLLTLNDKTNVSNNNTANSSWGYH